MKIGILTYHFGNNYGGILQCYALQQTLLALGHDVEIINYQPQGGRTLKHIIGRLRQQSSPKALFRFVSERIQKNKANQAVLHQQRAESLYTFDCFRSKYIRISPSVDVNNIGEYTNKHYDLIIVGSDQVWTSFYDEVPMYFMGWSPSFKGKKMSYAACSAYKEVAGKRARLLGDLLNDFDVITVRDQTTAQLVNFLTGNTPRIVPDPTLLYNFDEFKEAECVPHIPYILTYILGSEIEGGHKAALAKIKDKIGNLPVYAITIPGNSFDINPLADKVYHSLMPNEWVAMFRHASYVYTDSFHAIMFSLKFGIPFSAYYRNIVRASRLMDLKARGVSTIYGSVEEMEVDKRTKNSIDTLLADFNIAEILGIDL